MKLAICNIPMVTLSGFSGIAMGLFIGVGIILLLTNDLPDINLRKGHIQLSHQQRPQILLGSVSPLPVGNPQSGGTGDTSTNYGPSQIDEKIDKNHGIRDATIRSIGMLIGMPLGVLLVVAVIEIPYYWKAWKKAQAWKERKRHGE